MDFILKRISGKLCNGCAFESKGPGGLVSCLQSLSPSEKVRKKRCINVSTYPHRFYIFVKKP